MRDLIDEMDRANIKAIGVALGYYVTEDADGNIMMVPPGYLIIAEDLP